MLDVGIRIIGLTIQVRGTRCSLDSKHSKVRKDRFA